MIKMAMWTKAKLAEAADLKSVVLGGANPLIATKLNESVSVRNDGIIF